MIREVNGKMKIKIMILTDDKKYIDKFLKTAAVQYSQKLNVSVFTQKDKADEYLRDNRPNIVLIGEEFADEEFNLPKRTELVYFVNQKGIEYRNEHRAVCKYQTFSSIYTEILDIYSEALNSSVVLHSGGGIQSKVITFCGACGGVGTSTAAAACAQRLANVGVAVLYLNLETCGSADLYFSGTGGSSFSKVIYALAMQNASTTLKLESALKRDTDGVYYYSACESDLDMLELDAQATANLFEELNKTELFEVIIADVSFSYCEKIYQLIERSFVTVFVTDGSECANRKTQRCMNALSVVAQQREDFPIDRVNILYNRFGSKTSKHMDESTHNVVGGINRIKNADERGLVRLLAENDVFDNIVR